MDLNARVDMYCGRKDERTDGRKTGRLYRTLLKQVRQNLRNRIFILNTVRLIVDFWIAMLEIAFYPFASLSFSVYLLFIRGSMLEFAFFFVYR